MTIDGEFLFDNKLISELEGLIRNSKNVLFLVSPFIDLDKRIMDALTEKRTKSDFKLKILFGKNQSNLYKSVKKDSITFLKQFPNIEIRYEERLHAKFYLNDTHFILTSLNLYDFSLAKNIECGFIVNYASKGIIGKVVDGAEHLISSGVSKVKNDILGIPDNETDPIEKFNTVYLNSKVLYKTEPVFSETKGLTNILNKKKIEKFNVKIDELNFLESEAKRIEIKKEYRLFSASKLSKLIGIEQQILIDLMEKEGLIKNNSILESGTSQGLVKKSYMGKDYIAFPENLKILDKLKK